MYKSWCLISVSNFFLHIISQIKTFVVQYENKEWGSWFDLENGQGESISNPGPNCLHFT